MTRREGPGPRHSEAIIATAVVAGVLALLAIFAGPSLSGTYDAGLDDRPSALGSEGRLVYNASAEVDSVVVNFTEETVRDSRLEEREAILFSIDVDDQNVTFAVDAETGRVIGNSLGCREIERDGGERCLDLYGLLFSQEGSAPPLFIGMDTSGWRDQVSAPIGSQGSYRHVPLDVDQVRWNGMECRRTSTAEPVEEPWTAQEFWGVLRYTVPLTFCEEFPAPVKVEHPMVNLTLDSYEEAEAGSSFSWTLAEGAAPGAREGAVFEAGNRTPPQGEDSPELLTIPEALRYAEESNATVRRFLADHLEATVTRAEHQTSDAGLQIVPPGHPSDRQLEITFSQNETRTLTITSGEGMETLNVTVQKQRFAGTVTDYDVASVERGRGLFDDAAALRGNHSTLWSSFELVDRLIDTEYGVSWLFAQRSFPTDEPRWRYVHAFEGVRAEGFLYMAYSGDVDSRDGDLLAVSVDQDTAESLIPPSR